MIGRNSRIHAVRNVCKCRSVELSKKAGVSRNNGALFS